MDKKVITLVSGSKFSARCLPYMVKQKNEDLV